MKFELTAYLDYLKSDLDEQLNLATKLEIRSFFLRRINGKRINDLTDQEFNSIAQQLTKQKVKVIGVDPMIDAYNLSDLEGKKHFEEELIKATTRAKQLKADFMYYVIPKFVDVMKDTDFIISHIKEHLSIIKKSKLDVLLKPANGHKSNTYRYILGILKDDKVTINFDPVYFYTNKESNVTAYRILREYISVFVANDLDKEHNPRLIGLGQLDVLEMYKKLLKNDYKGFVVLDSDLPELLDAASKIKWYHKLSGKKRLEKKILVDFIERRGQFSLYDCIHYQWVVLNVIFYNRKID